LKYTPIDPLEALSNFKPNFYDLLLIDINLPNMNGFELCEKLLKMDINMRVCFISAGEVNHEAIREIHPSINIGCFIKKPLTVQDLIKRVKKAELEKYRKRRSLENKLANFTYYLHLQ
jgi:response regulator RpfG family c-di-GMP phosphodiesterase